MRAVTINFVETPISRFFPQHLSAISESIGSPFVSWDLSGSTSTLSTRDPNSYQRHTSLYSLLNFNQKVSHDKLQWNGGWGRGGGRWQWWESCGCRRFRCRSLWPFHSRFPYLLCNATHVSGYSIFIVNGPIPDCEADSVLKISPVLQSTPARSTRPPSDRNKIHSNESCENAKE